MYMSVCVRECVCGGVFVCLCVCACVVYLCVWVGVYCAYVHTTAKYHDHTSNTPELTPHCIPNRTIPW